MSTDSLDETKAHKRTPHTKLVTHRHRLSNNAKHGPKCSVADVRLGLGKTVRQHDSTDLPCDAMECPGPQQVEVASVGLAGVEGHLRRNGKRSNERRDVSTDL